jgi:hypothetical protein
MNGNTELLKIYSQEENSKASQLNPTLESSFRTDSVVSTDELEFADCGGKL